MLMNLTPGFNFTNVLRAAFAPISLRQKKSNLSVSTEKLLKRLLYEKGAHKMLVKLTPYLRRIGILDFEPQSPECSDFSRHNGTGSSSPCGT